MLCLRDCAMAYRIMYDMTVFSTHQKIDMLKACTTLESYSQIHTIDLAKKPESNNTYSTKHTDKCLTKWASD